MDELIEELQAEMERKIYFIDYKPEITLFEDDINLVLQALVKFKNKSKNV